MLGHIDPPELGRLVLVPAPTRVRAARSRGGDPVRRFASAAAESLEPEFVSVPSVLRMGRGVRDSVGLGAAARAENVAGHVQFVRPSRRRREPNGDAGPASEPTVLLVDDVLTTGATASESVCVLAEFGIRVDGVVVIAAV